MALAQVPQPAPWVNEFEFDSDRDSNAQRDAEPLANGELVVVDRNSELRLLGTERPEIRKLDLPETPETFLAGPTGDELKELSQWIRWLTLMNLPPNYEDNRKWGRQRKVYDGVDMKFDGLRLDTKRKWKLVDHGTWSRYFIEFVDPVHRMDISIDRLEMRPNGRGFFSSLQIVAPLKLFGRVSQFHRDVQLMSVSVQADATVAMRVDVDVEIRINPLVFPPEVEFRPQAKAANVELRAFEVHRISQIHGDTAEWMGKGIRRVLDQKLSEYNDQLVVKINKEIAKQQSKLKLSAQDWLSSSMNRNRSRGGE